MTRKETTVPPVAVVGLGLRLPGGISTSEDLWSLLINKRDARGPVPASRWNAEGWSNNTASGHGYFLDEDADLKKFDSSMFSMNRTELEALDPRQKLLLEVVWECMENAGQKNWRGSRTGVFVGNFGQDWMEMTARDPLMKGAFRVYNGADFYLSNRVSYEYNLSGPSMAIQTACSSGLTVIHEACEALYNGDCKGAIVAGTSLLLSPLVVEVMTEQGVLSPDGSCRTFSADANGYARGEGINAVYLKLLDDAIRDGDPIRAVIRGTALSANGKTAGMSLPDAKHQQEAIEQAYKVAGISDLTQTPFVECHGTGTPTGDPIEVNGVIEAFGTSGENGKPTYIGSIKPNLGHAEGASGISSLIKAVLAVENRVIPPNIKFNKPNPKIPFDTAKVIVPVEPTPFPTDRATRVSINSFGIGGSNAHLIVDSAAEFLQNHLALPSPAPSPNSSSLTAEWPRLVVLTSSNMSSLNSRVRDMKDYIDARPRTILNDLANTLATRRAHLSQRSFSVITQTQNEPYEFEKPQVARTEPPQPVFVFTGQGAQWGGMGSDLLKIFPEFAEDIHSMDAALAKLGPAAPKWTVEKMIAAEDAETKALFGKPEFSQPLCTAIQIGALRFLEKCGIKPSAVVGHSSGEIAAAYAAGGLTLQEAIVTAYLRGWAVEQAKETRLKGGMAAIGLGKVDVEKYVRPGIVIACENSPQSVTLSGDEDALEATLADIAKTLAFNRRLRVDVAYHSHHMKAIGGEYETVLSPQLSKSSKNLDVPFYSSVTLKKVKNSEAFDSAYWRSNLESPVRFDTAVQSIIADRADKDLVFVEVGPHSALQGPLRQISQAAVQKGRSAGKALLYIPTFVRNVPARISLTKTAGHAFSQGIHVNFDFLTPPSATAKPLTDLPRYPWDHSSEFWNESRLSAAHRFPKYCRHELLGSRGLESTDLEPMWRNIIAPNDIPWAQDHIVGNDAVLPCTGYVSIMGEALRQLSGRNDAGYTLRDVVVKSALVLPTSREVEITTTARLVCASSAGSPDAWYDFSISMYNGSSWVQLCVGKGRAGPEPGYHTKASLESAEKFSREISPAPWYERLTHVGLTYGPRFQALSAISAAPGKLACSATLDAYFDKEHGKKPPAIYAQHPVTLDAVLQMGFVAATSGLARRLKSAALPTAVDFIYVKPSGGIKSLYAQGFVAENASKGKSLGWHSGKVVNPETNDVVIDIKRCHFTYFKSQVKSHGLGSSFDHVGAARLVWRPDIELSKPEIAMKPLPEFHRLSKTLLEKIVALCVLRSIDVLATEKAKAASAIKFAEPYLEKYTSWLSTEKANMLSGGGSWSSLCPEAKAYATMSIDERENEYAIVEAQIVALGSCHNDVAVITRLCRKLAEQMYALSVGETNSVEILFNRNSETLVSLYDFLGDLLDFSEFFKLCGHANPYLRILEIGAGTGASASRVLRALAADPKKPRYAEYTFTDVSSGFFESARERLKEYPSIKYKVLDISKDPADQGFQLGSYDLIVASNVIHATPLLKQTLTNTRALLRDGGRFYLQEIVGSTNLFKFLVGAFSGWWLGEADDRAEAPTIPVERWNRELTAVGFSGAGDAVLDDDKALAYMANIVTRALPAEKPATVAKTATVIYQKEKPAFAASVSATLTAHGFSISWEKLADFASSATAPSVIISTLDLERPFFSDLSDTDYALLMKMISGLSSPLVWLTHAIQMDVEDPRYGQIIGLARNVRNELSKTFATVELGAFDAASAEAVTTIVQSLVSHVAGVASVNHDVDAEFSVKNGVVYTPRYETLSMAYELAEKQGERTSITLVSGEVGSFSKTKWLKAAITSRLEAHDVEVNVQATSLNYKYHDALLSSNSLEGSETLLGVEAAGIVSRIGALVDNVKVGDRVVLLASGAVSSVKRVKKDLVMKIPEGLNFLQAATMPISYITAIRALSNLEAEQTVLIHSASGSLGQAAIQVALMLGAKVYATAGTEEKADFISSEFGIPPARIFSSRNSSFLHKLKAATDGEGVDVVLNTLPGDLLHASWECVAAYGKMINVTREHEQLPANVLTSNRTFICLDISTLIHDRPVEVKRLLKKTLDHFAHGHIKPVTVSEVFSAKDVSDGFTYLHTNQHIGRVMLSFEASKDLDTVATKKQQSINFSSFKTYLLAGGMGGLGKSISTWMVEHGARNFVFLSRSAGTSAADKAFIKELESQGCRVKAIAGSVADAETVKRAVQSAPSRLGGIMQLSMVLHDAALRDMTFEQWMAAQGPKVDGTWNLHNAMANNPLDFFILFSSISALSGYPGQANYTAASTFIEAFAQYRQRQGLACSVVNIGAVQGVGYISRSKAISAMFANIGQSMLQEQDVLDAMQISIQQSFGSSADNLSAPVGNDNNGEFSFAGQLITGLRSTRLTSETNSRVPWKRDIRTSIVQADEAVMITRSYASDTSNASVATPDSASDPNEAPEAKLRDLVRIATADPQMLKAKSTLDSVVRNIGRVLCRILLQPEEGLENGVTLSQMGLDSMVSIEIRNWWKRTFLGEISVLQIMNAVTVERLGELAVETLQKHVGGSV